MKSYCTVTYRIAGTFASISVRNFERTVWPFWQIGAKNFGRAISLNKLQEKLDIICYEGERLHVMISYWFSFSEILKSRPRTLSRKSSRNAANGDLWENSSAAENAIKIILISRRDEVRNWKWALTFGLPYRPLLCVRLEKLAEKKSTSGNQTSPRGHGSQIVSRAFCNCIKLIRACELQTYEKNRFSGERELFLKLSFDSGVAFNWIDVMVTAPFTSFTKQ